MDEQLRLKYALELKEIQKVSLSSQADRTLVLHVPRNDRDKSKKGDMIFIVDNVVELVTRMYTAYHKLDPGYLDINISDAFMVTIDAKGSTRVQFDRGSASDVCRLVHRWYMSSTLSFHSCN